jgi:anti-sigma factor RsiW
MFCFQAGRLIHRFLDRELDRESSARLEAHLRACASCRQALADLLDLEDQLDAAVLPEIRSAFAARVAAQALNSTPPLEVHTALGWLPAAAAVLGFVAMVWAGFRIGETYRPAPGRDIIQVVLSSPIEPGL